MQGDWRTVSMIGSIVCAALCGQLDGRPAVVKNASSASTAVAGLLALSCRSTVLAWDRSQGSR